jgi:hypothetical protein
MTGTFLLPMNRISTINQEKAIITVSIIKHHARTRPKQRTGRNPACGWSRRSQTIGKACRKTGRRHPTWSQNENGMRQFGSTGLFEVSPVDIIA